MEGILDWLRGLPPALSVFVLSLLPIFELRGSIPYGLLVARLPLYEVLLISIIGNWLVAPIVYYLLPLVVRQLRRLRWLDRAWEKYSHGAQQRMHRAVEKQGSLGIALFIGIPLPGTGVYTGALGAYLLGMSFRRFMGVALIGVLIAATIVTAAVLTGSSAFDWIINRKALSAGG